MYQQDFIFPHKVSTLRFRHGTRHARDRIRIKPKNPSADKEIAETMLPRTKTEQKENRNSRSRNINKTETSDVFVSRLCIFGEKSFSLSSAPASAVAFAAGSSTRWVTIAEAAYFSLLYFKRENFAAAISRYKSSTKSGRRRTRRRPRRRKRRRKRRRR